MGDDTDLVEPQGRNYSTHPIRSLLSTLGTHLPPGWSWHYVDGNAFAFILAKATFDLTTWSTHWDETVLLQVWSCMPIAQPFACVIYYSWLYRDAI